MSEHLTRQLRGRHIQLIAIGGTIGVGLFLGSAKAIQRAGPGLILSYAAAGVAVFFIMRALGEILVRRPESGALAVMAEEFVGPFAGFATAWTYWFFWVVVGMGEITAIGIYAHYWAPAIPQWMPALGVLLLLYGSNMLGVRAFGEMEFWFAIIKVATIVVLLVAGVLILIFGFSALGPAASIANLWRHGGFFPFGLLGVLLTFLFFLAQQGQGPEALGHLSRRHVPVRGVTVSAAAMLIGVALNAIVPEKAFTWVTSIALIGTLWTWSIIMLAHLKFRRAVAQGREQPSAFPMPGAPAANWLVIAFLLTVTAMLALDEGTRVALYVAPIWFAVLGAAYFRWKRNLKLRAPLQLDEPRYPAAPHQ